MSNPDSEEIRTAVRERYASIARQVADAQRTGAACCGPATADACSGSEDDACVEATATGQEKEHAQSLYGQDALERLPSSVTDISLGCGNPTAIAALKPGEVVLDLGSGGGIDCFLAAEKVGPQGKAIGVDMTPDMISLARENARKMNAGNVEFRLGEMEHLPVESETVDVIISNCVINLSPDKDTVFREALRVLKPGGRFSVSDVVVTGELPEDKKRSLEEWAGCVAGALHKDDYATKLAAAGFTDIEMQRATPAGLEVVGGGAACCGTDDDSCGTSDTVVPNDLSSVVASMEITARKPD